MIKIMMVQYRMTEGISVSVTISGLQFRTVEGLLEYVRITSAIVLLYPTKVLLALIDMMRQIINISEVNILSSAELNMHLEPFDIRPAVAVEALGAVVAVVAAEFVFAVAVLDEASR